MTEDVFMKNEINICKLVYVLHSGRWKEPCWIYNDKKENGPQKELISFFFKEVVFES